MFILSIYHPYQWYETCGRVVIEAFATGTPAIASNLGKMASLIDSGPKGLYFRQGDPWIGLQL